MTEEILALKERIQKLESTVSNLLRASTYAYIALLSLPKEIKAKDPDFTKSTKIMKENIDEIFARLKEEA